MCGYTAHCKTRVLRLMWTPLRAAGCVYQWISTVPGANSAGPYTLTSINLLWPGLEPHPPRGSNPLPLPLSLSISLPLLPLSLSLTATLFFPLLLRFFLIYFDSLSSSYHLPHPTLPLPLPFPSISLPLSDLIPPLNLSPVKWCTRNAEVVNLWGERSIKQGQAERSTQRQCVLCRRWAPPGHKSCHPGSLLGKERWPSSSSSSSSGGSKGVTVNSYVSHPITASGTDKSILAGVMKGTLMHVHNWVASMKYEWAVSYMSWQHTVDGFSYEGGTCTGWDELTMSCWW